MNIDYYNKLYYIKIVMRCNSYNNYKVSCGNFRLPIRRISLNRAEVQVKDMYLEFNNENAETLYKQGLKAKGIKEKVAFFEAMGHGHILDERINRLRERVKHHTFR